MPSFLPSRSYIRDWTAYLPLLLAWLNDIVAAILEEEAQKICGGRDSNPFPCAQLSGTLPTRPSALVANDNIPDDIISASVVSKVPF